jgi:hypothetical protein
LYEHFHPDAARLSLAASLQYRLGIFSRVVDKSNAQAFEIFRARRVIDALARGRDRRIEDIHHWCNSLFRILPAI